MRGKGRFGFDFAYMHLSALAPGRPDLAPLGSNTLPSL